MESNSILKKFPDFVTDSFHLGKLYTLWQKSNVHLSVYERIEKLKAGIYHVRLRLPFEMNRWLEIVVRQLIGW